MNSKQVYVETIQRHLSLGKGKLKPQLETTTSLFKGLLFFFNDHTKYWER